MWQAPDKLWQALKCAKAVLRLSHDRLSGKVDDLDQCGNCSAGIIRSCCEDNSRYAKAHQGLGLPSVHILGVWSTNAPLCFDKLLTCSSVVHESCSRLFYRTSCAAGDMATESSPTVDGDAPGSPRSPRPHQAVKAVQAADPLPSGTVTEEAQKALPGSLQALFNHHPVVSLANIR